MATIDYYAVLEVTPTATEADIRRAYQRLALLHHPDRPQNTDQSTEKFQQIADAYFILSDKPRRASYDRSRARKDTKEQFEFVRTDANGVFGDVFEEMLRPEVPRPGWIWWFVGMLAGMVIGLIIANIPGLIMGALAGGKLGSIRDNKGKPVMEVFNGLGRDQKYAVLQGLAKKVLS